MARKVENIDVISRRNFITQSVRAVVGVGLGATLGEKALVPLSIAVNETTRTITGNSVGNAGYVQLVKENCPNEINTTKCVREYVNSIPVKVSTVIMSPFIEETLFRSLPSLVASILEKRENPIADVISGTGNPLLSRREWLFGSGMAVFFGLSHNQTETGFDTKTIPASQTLMGIIFWYLQRMFGVGSNLAAHIALNYKIITSI
jgi:hypothetical protein